MHKAWTVVTVVTVVLAAWAAAIVVRTPWLVASGPWLGVPFGLAFAGLLYWTSRPAWRLARR